MNNNSYTEFDDFWGEITVINIPPEKTDVSEYSDILEVAERGKVARFVELKAKHIEIDFNHAPNECLDTCLNYACYGNNIEMVKHLIQVEGAIPTFDHCYTAIDNWRFEALDELLSNGADPHANNNRLTYYAAILNNGALEILAKHGAKDYTPILNQFIESDHTEAAIYMLEHGAKPDIETLSLAARIEDLTILKHLLTDKGMVPPNQEWTDSIPDLFIEAKNLLNKAALQARLQSKFKKKSQSQGMKI